MRTAPRRRAAQPKPLKSGPWKGTRTTVDSEDDAPNLLYDATNIYVPDPEGGSGVYARPGMSLRNGGVALVVSGSAFRGQAAFSHTDLSGVTTNFVVLNGRLLRVDPTIAIFTDVSPVGITISNATTTRVYATSFADQLIVTDGVNRPWLATNLSSTPITGTYIDFDGAGGAWSAFGPAVIYAGSVFWILAAVSGAGARTDIAWSNPADASTGYQQLDFDFRWTLEQTATNPLFALAGTNTQLYYWRENSIGSISGIPGPNLQGQATHDAVSRNVGTLSPQSVVQFGSSVFFVDALGRPYRYVQGAAAPEAIWLQLRGIVDASTSGFPSVNKTVATAAFEPTLNLYIVAPWSFLPSQNGPAVEGYIFDARTGTYFSRFVVGPGVQLETLGSFIDVNGRGVLVVLGSGVAPTASGVATSGFLWTMNAILASGDFLTTEAGVFLTTEAGVSLTTEGTPANWTDNGATPLLSATTTRMGYDTEYVVTVDRATAMVGSTSPCAISVATAAVIETTEGTPVPSVVQDGIGRLTVGCDGIQGRGITVTVRPTTADSQWSLQAVSANVVTSISAPDEA